MIPRLVQVKQYSFLFVKANSPVGLTGQTMHGLEKSGFNPCLSLFQVPLGQSSRT